jgi:hypothetical protein
MSKLYPEVGKNNFKDATMQHLQHFGVHGTRGPQRERSFQQLLLDFVEAHKRTITSLTMPISCMQDSLDFVGSLCGKLPILKKLELQDDYSKPRAWVMSDEVTFLSSLVETLSAPGSIIEDFTFMCIVSPFTPPIAGTFKP